MVLVSRRLGMRMAIDAGERRIVRREGVAIAACGPFARVRATVIDREPGVIKSGAGPGRSVVTRCARGGETSRNMVRIRSRRE